MYNTEISVFNLRHCAHNTILLLGGVSPSEVLRTMLVLIPYHRGTNWQAIILDDSLNYDDSELPSINLQMPECSQSTTDKQGSSTLFSTVTTVVILLVSIGVYRKPLNDAKLFFQDIKERNNGEHISYTERLWKCAHIIIIKLTLPFNYFNSAEHFALTVLSFRSVGIKVLLRAGWCTPLSNHLPYDYNTVNRETFALKLNSRVK